MRRLFLALAVLAAVAASAPAGAAAPPAAVVGVEQYRYIPGDTTGSVPVATEVRIAAGGRLFLANADPSAPHTLTGPVQPDGAYLFDTPYEVNQGDVAESLGVSRLAPGTYTFFCKLHTNLMQGRLVVEPAA
ncbi:MAG TPA: cupredoxin domain-containing protein [Acidimicrobiales bacterium]|jgi:plastocyanin|nr:cupredoxin domain-containing protein [Acidimicrobiales bacterium]